LTAIRSLQKPGQPDILEKVIGLYLNSAPDIFKALQQAIEVGDPEKLRAAAHSLKSSSANLGANKLSSLCKTMETKGREGKLEDAGLTLSELEQAFRLATQELEYICRTDSAASRIA
jgi:HPt (histidine-containing phosphotransfer) domain-containing protein